MLPLILGGISLASKLFGGGSKGMEQERLKNDQANALRDQTAERAMFDRERALQDRSKLEMDQVAQQNKSQADAMKRALFSQYLGGWSPAGRPDGVEMVRGGFNTIPAGSQEAAKEFERQAMLKLMAGGDQFSQLPAMERFTPTPLSKASTKEKIFGMLGLGGSVLDGLGAMGAFKPQVPFVGDMVKRANGEETA